MASDAVEAAISAQKCLECDHRRRALADVWATALDTARGMRLVLHGGAAVNAALPPEAQFYGAGEVHDLDLLSDAPSEQKTVQAFRGLMVKAGATAPMRVHPALHRGTYVLRVRDTVLADVTRAAKADLQKLRTAERLERAAARRPPPKTPGGLASVPVAYMKLSMHLELSRPAVFIERWRKVEPRLAALYAAHPRLAVPTPPPPPGAAGPDLSEFAEAARRDPANLTVVGEVAVRRLLDGVPSPAAPTLLATDVPAARALFGSDSAWTRRPASMFSGEQWALPDGRGRVVQAPPNLSRNEVDGAMHGTPDLVLQYLYADVLDAPDQAHGLGAQIDAIAASLMHASPREDPAWKRLTPSYFLH